MEIAQEMLTTFNDDPNLLKKVLTGDKLWVKSKLNHPNRKNFAMNEEIIKESKLELLAILRSAFQKCFEDWKKCWHMCILSEGGYFEGVKILIAVV